MKVSKLSNYDKFIVMAENSGTRMSLTRTSYVYFKEVMEAITAIARSNEKSFEYKGAWYPKPLSSEKANNLREFAHEAKFNVGFMKVANALKINLRDKG